MNKITNIIGLKSTKQSICAFVLLLSLILTSSLSMKTVYVSADDNTPGEIIVTFKKDGAGGGDTVVKIKSGECVDLKFPTKGLSKTVEENYEDVVYDQVGWSTAKNQQTSNVTPGTVFTKDTDVWPVWESSETAVPKPVFFAPNGGKGEIENIKVIGKIGNQMPVKIPEKEGFEFKGWSKSPDSQAADVNKNTYVSSYMVCYAVWEKKSSGFEEQIEALQKQVEALKKEIKEYEDKLAKITEKYSSLVTAMETLKEKFEQATTALNKTIEERDKAISEKNKAIEEKNKATNEKHKAIEEKNKAISEKDKAVKERDKAKKELEITKKIIAAKSLNVKNFTVKITGNTAKISWKKNFRAQGYLLMYNEVSKKKTITLKIGKNSISKYSIKKLKKGCVYRFQICTYKKIKNRFVYGIYSRVKLKIK